MGFACEIAMLVEMQIALWGRYTPVNLELHATSWELGLFVGGILGGAGNESCVCDSQWMTELEVNMKSTQRNIWQSGIRAAGCAAKLGAS